MQPEHNAERPAAATSVPLLTPTQLHALFDILTHFETYDEVEQFKYPGTIGRYGYPFRATSAATGSDPESASASSAPLLAELLRTLILPVPGINQLPPEFWGVRLQGILTTLAEADLSESYDKGALGTRKTLATAASVIHESVTRGCLGGYPEGRRRDLSLAYDPAKAEDLIKAWEDGVHEIVYGELIDELFDFAIEKDSLEDHSQAVKVAADYVVIHLATFIHQIIVLSPEGQYILKLVENVHKLIPYSLIRQTLRIGNAATMINGMMKLLLAKMTVGALTNWVGWTQNADDGMNLLQRIMSMVLSWDSSEFRKSAEAIEKAKGGPSKEHLSVIKQYAELSRDEHEALRVVSKEKPLSIVYAIFENMRPDLLVSLSEAHHIQCLDYYSATLSIRDREQISNVLCRQTPDNFTQAVRDLIGSFEPIIRTIHEHVDIREHLSGAEALVNDFISTSKPKKHENGTKEAKSTELPPSVEDYVRFLQRNKQLLYNWLHQVAANCPEIRESFRAWAKTTIKGTFAQHRDDTEVPTPGTPKFDTFKNRDAPPQAKQRSTGAGGMSSALERLFGDLQGDEQNEILPLLNAHAIYLSTLEDLSTKRMQRVVDNLRTTSSSGDSTSKRTPANNSPGGSSSMCGPGMFLSRWQAALDRTLITPATPTGPPRSGKDVKGSPVQGKVGVLGLKDAWDSESLAAQAQLDVPEPPAVDAVVRAMGPAFKGLVVDMVNKLAKP